MSDLNSKKKIADDISIYSNQNLIEMLNKYLKDVITIIIPIYVRQKHILRSHSLFFNTGFNIIYCDFSPKPYDFSKNIKYQYFSLLQFSDIISILLTEVNTEYVCLCGDEGFLVPETELDCVDFLNKHREFCIASGKSLYFNYSFDGYYTNYTFSFINKNIFGIADERAQQLFSNYQQLFWSVYRTELIIEGFNALKQTKFCNANFNELLLGTIVCCKLNIVFSNSHLNVRQVPLFEKHWGSLKVSPLISKSKRLFNAKTRKYKQVFLIESKKYNNHIGKIVLHRFSTGSFSSLIRKCLVNILPKKIKLFLIKNKITTPKISIFIEDFLLRYLYTNYYKIKNIYFCKFN